MGNTNSISVISSRAQTKSHFRCHAARNATETGKIMSCRNFNLPEMSSVWVQINSGKVASTGVSRFVVVILALKLTAFDLLSVCEFFKCTWPVFQTLAVINEWYWLFRMCKSESMSSQLRHRFGSRLGSIIIVYFLNKGCRRNEADTQLNLNRAEGFP